MTASKIKKTMEEKTVLTREAGTKKIQISELFGTHTVNMTGKAISEHKVPTSNQK